MDAKTLEMVEDAKGCCQEAVSNLLEQAKGMVINTWRAEPFLKGGVHDYEDFYQMLFLKVLKVKGPENPRNSENFFGWLKSVAFQLKIEIIRREFYRTHESLDSLESNKKDKKSKELSYLISSILNRFFTKTEAKIIFCLYLDSEKHTANQIIDKMGLPYEESRFSDVKKDLLNRFRMILNALKDSGYE